MTVNEKSYLGPAQSPQFLSDNLVSESKPLREESMYVEEPPRKIRALDPYSFVSKSYFDLLPYDFVSNFVLYSIDNTTKFVVSSSTSGKIGKIKGACEQTVNKNAAKQELTIIAAKNGYGALLIWGVKNECILSKDTFQAAAEKGDLDTMKWLKEKGCPWDYYTFTVAAQNGSLDNMKWLKEKGCPWTPWTFANAAQNGSLDNMKWLLANGCPWNASTFIEAAHFGNLDTMKWLLANGCPWNRWTFSAAAQNGNLDNMKWLHANGCPFDAHTFSNAALRGDVETLIWLKEQNCPWDETIFVSIASIDQKLEQMKTEPKSTAVQWLIANRYWNTEE